MSCFLFSEVKFLNIFPIGGKTGIKKQHCLPFESKVIKIMTIKERNMERKKLRGPKLR